MPREVSEIISAIIAAIIVLTVLIIFIIAFLLIYYRRYHKHLYEKQQLQARFEQELLKSELETLQNISQEIHDNVGQVLSLARLNLGSIEAKEPEIVQAKVEDIENLITKAMNDLQRLGKSMNPGYVEEMGFLRCIEYEIESLRKSGKFETRLEVVGDLQNCLSMQEAVILYRISQEAINNIIKHASATNINVQLNYTASHFILLISDNGRGFDLNTLKSGKEERPGLGIRNMISRSHLINADFIIDSAPGKGTEVKVILPFISRIKYHDKN